MGIKPAKVDCDLWFKAFFFLVIKFSTITSCLLHYPRCMYFCSVIILITNENSVCLKLFNSGHICLDTHIHTCARGNHCDFWIEILPFNIRFKGTILC